MDRQRDQLMLEVEKLRGIVQSNESLQEEVTKDIESIEDELGQVEILMKGMKTDILQYRYALNGMNEYEKELEIVGFKFFTWLLLDQQLLHCDHT